MLATHRSQPRSTPRRGIILLVVLALLTLFASIGVAFVYFAEQEANKSLDQKAGETVKLPDPDMMYAYVMKQIVFPTTNTNSALFTHSLLENMYGKTGVDPFSGTGVKPHLYRDHRPAANVIDPQVAAGPYTTIPALIGQDEMYRINRQYRNYDENQMGSLNPPYTYPDHKNPYLGGVSGNWTDMNGNQHDAVAVARSWAREIKLRIAVIDSSAAPGTPNVRAYHDVIINPFSAADYSFWSRSTAPLVAPGMDVFIKPLGNLPPLLAPLQYVPTPGAPVIAPAPQPVIQCNADGTNAWIVMNAEACRAHSLRPDPRNNPLFPPPGDNGGDVKNLPPEVKTHVGFTGTAPNITPVFANNDSYWMDLGFPAMPWSNNRRIKPLAAVFIMDNDGKVNMNTAGNLRGFDPVNGSYHTSSQGWGPWEVNPRKLYPTNAALSAQMDQEVRQLFGGLQLSQNRYLRGRYGIDPNAGIAVDPSTFPVNTGYLPFGNASLYLPLLRQAPYYANYNVDGTLDNAAPPIPNYSWSPAPQLPGQASIYGRFPSNINIAQGYGNGAGAEFTRTNVFRSPFFASPFALTQPPPPPQYSGFSNNVGSSYRTFALQNTEAFYRALDTGTDKIDSDIRRLMPILFTNPFSRWQMTATSMDLNASAVTPWFDSNTGDAALPHPALLDANTARPAAASRPLPWGAPAAPAGEFVGGGATNPLWRSIFGNTDRIDLAKQLPDYPLPANNNSHLAIGTPLVRNQYLIALQARQKLADQIFWRLVNLAHPRTPAGPTANNSPLWMAQMAVNIVDYIDNDDYPTWYQVPNISTPTPTPSAPTAANIVWGTELPRLVINEVLCEAVNGNTGPSPTGNTHATGDYHVRHWVELYNPLSTPAPLPAPQFAAWPDGANARLNVNGTSVYRLIFTPQTNINTIQSNRSNTMGYPTNTADTNTIVVPFNGLTAANINVPPSDLNYGSSTATGQGFYLVGTPQQPLNTAPPPAPDDPFPTNDYDTPLMQSNDRIPRASGAFLDSASTRQAVLLQRLANPYLPHNPLNDPTVQFQANPGVTTPEATLVDPAMPYNPYITIDYLANVTPNHAVEHDSSDQGTADLVPVDQRAAIGKLQPYAGLNERPIPPDPAKPPQPLWVTQTPDRDLTAPAPNIQPLRNQPQHTFRRHNSIEAANPRYGQRAGGASDSAYVNTLQLPFDWLVHLDRAPVSPAELLHVSGYRPHELTQKFHGTTSASATASLIPPVPGPTINLTPGTNVRFTGNFIGTGNIAETAGIPFALKLNDLVQVTYTPNPPNATGTPVVEWVRVNNIDSNYTWFEGEVSNTNVVNTAVNVQMIVPFAHTAPWYRSMANVDVQSTNRLYRLLECLAVRNPGVDIGQVRFQGVDPIVANPDGTCWVQLNPTVGISGMPLVTTNDALLGLEAGFPAAMQTPPLPFNQPTYAPFIPATPAYPNHVGDTVVFFAGTLLEYRAMVLEVNWQTNRIRTVLPPVLTPGRTFTVDYTFHSGRQPGKINLNTMWDIETMLALADVKPMNAFYYGNPTERDALVKLAFQRLYQQRQPGYFYTPRLIGHTGVNNIGEDRPLQGMGTGDIAPDREIPRQGVGNTLLSARHSEGGYAPYEANGPVAGLTPLYSTNERDLGTLFEFYQPQDAPVITPPLTLLPDPAKNHPYRRFELLSKIWNNSTVRSNTFSVWVTIGFFEYDETTGIGAELGQIQGKNIRHRFFSVVDRTSIDSWLKSWEHWAFPGNPSGAPPANVNLFANTAMFPTLDPRDLTYPAVPFGSPTSSVLSTAFGPIGVGNVWQITSVPEHGATNPFQNMPGRLVEVQITYSTGATLSEQTMLLNPTPIATTPIYDNRYVFPAQPYTPQQIFARMSLPSANAVLVTMRPLPVPPTVLHWSQLK